jgi:hypothetical protein
MILIHTHNRSKAFGLILKGMSGQLVEYLLQFSRAYKLPRTDFLNILFYFSKLILDAHFLLFFAFRFFSMRVYNSNAGMKRSGAKKK